MISNLWTFEFEVTDRLHWPSNFGRVTVLADEHLEAFYAAHHMVYGLRGVEMVTDLVCIDWPEELWMRETTTL